MRFFVFAALAAVLFLPLDAHARPISYPGGWMAMTMNDFSMNEFELSYTVAPTWAVGVQHDYFRNDGVNADTAKVTYLLHRWNAPDSQGNLYLQSGAGTAWKDGSQRAAVFTGVTADWESRRWFLSYDNRFFDAGNIERYAHHSTRVGIAPYIGHYGDLHTWLMLQTDYYTNQDKNFSVTPLVRLFKGNDLAEFGVNLRGGVLFHYMHTF